jgi:hypothetical protein
MLHATGLPMNLWGEALKHAVWLKNRTSTKALGGRTPYEAFHKSKPDLHNIHEWGCEVSVHVADASKLDGRAPEGRWIGYDLDSINGHRIYYPDNWSIRVEQSVKFPEVKRSGEIYRVLNEGEKVEIWVKENLESIQHAPVIALQPIPTASHLPTPSSPLTTPPSTPPRNSESTSIALRDISSAIDPRNIVGHSDTTGCSHCRRGGQ